MVSIARRRKAEMLTELRIAGFKSFHDDHTIGLRRINVFIGPNGSGKSSILQAILLWSQNAGSSEFGSTGKWMDLGPLEELLADQANKNALGLTYLESITAPAFFETEDPKPVQIKIDVALNRPLNIEVAMTAGSLNLLLHVPQRPIEEEKVDFDFGSFGVVGSLASPIVLRNRAVGYEKVAAEISVMLELLLKHLTNRIRFVPANRGFTKSSYDLGQGIGNDFADSIEAEANADRLATSLAYDSELRGKLGSVLKTLTGVELDNELRSDRTVSPVSIRSTNRGTVRVGPTNEGFGTNQLISTLAQIFVTPTNGVILIEEPETHLHPSAQAKFGMWMARHAVDHKKQLLIATHSERFLASLLYQVRQEILTPADIAVYYVSLDDNGYSQIERKDITSGGIIQGSFRDLFDTGVGVPDWQEFFRGLNS